MDEGDTDTLTDVKEKQEKTLVMTPRSVKTIA